MAYIYYSIIWKMLLESLSDVYGIRTNSIKIAYIRIILFLYIYVYTYVCVMLVCAQYDMGNPHPLHFIFSYFWPRFSYNYYIRIWCLCKYTFLGGGLWIIQWQGERLSRLSQDIEERTGAVAEQTISPRWCGRALHAFGACATSRYTYIILYILYVCYSKCG